MKKYIDKITFILSYAFKNIIFGKLKTLALFLTFVIIFVTTFSILTVKPLVRDFYYHKLDSKYLNFDLSMTVYEKTNARFFSIRYLPEENIESIAPFFEINTLMVSSYQEYVKIMVGDLDSLKKVTTNVSSKTLENNEVIITQSVANKFKIKKDDDIYLQLDDNAAYQVVEIVNDGGLFTNNTVFIDKDSNVGQILRVLGLEKYNPNIIKNLYNIVYLDVTNIDVIDEIKAIEEYQNLKILPVYNEELVEQNIQKAISSFLIIFVFILLAILFVLQSTLMIMFKDKIKQIGVIKSLGGKNSFFLSIIITEVIFYILLSFLCSIFVTNIILNKGLAILNSTLIYKLDIKTLITGILMVLVIAFVFICYNYLKIKNTSAIALSKDNNLANKKRIGFYFLASIVLLLINLVFNNHIKIKSVISSFLVIVIGFILSKLLLYLGKLIRKRNIFTVISVKIINQNKTIFHNLNIALVSFFTIILFVISVNYYNSSTKQIYEEIYLDYQITNIVHDIETVTEEVRQMDGVISADEGYQYINIPVDQSDLIIDYMISLPSDKLLNYLHLPLEDLTKLSDKKTAYIFLPVRYKYIYDYQVGDVISLKIEQIDPKVNEEFIIGGFFEGESSFVAITNMADCSKYQDVAKNTIMVNASKNDNLVYQNLITRYKSLLYYIVDVDTVLDNLLEEINTVVRYLTYISTIIIICFILTLFNNTILIFAEMKTTYAKLKVLGLSNRKLTLMLLKENSYLLIVLIISVCLMIIGFVPNVKYMVLYYGVYFPLQAHFIDFVYGIGICIIMYIISYLYYFVCLKKVNIVEELKI